MLPPMTTPANPRLDPMLSTGVGVGWGASLPPAGPVADALFEFGAGHPDPGSFPYEGMVEATADVMKAEGAPALSYGEPQGYKGLRDLVVQKYRLFENLDVSPDDIIVSNGSGHALSLAFSAFVDVGDAILSEAPTFSGTLATIRRHGARVLDVPLDDEGMVTSVAREQLEKLRREGKPCKLIYTIVNFQNPAGPHMSGRRREELIGVGDEYETVILEDDAYGELRFEGPQHPSLFALDKGGRTIRSGTLSKILGAGVRLGWLCAPRQMIPAFQGFLFGGGVNPYVSRVATFYMRDNLVPHVARLVDVYRSKRDAMLKGLWEGLKDTDVEISKPGAGFFMWIRLPKGTDTKKLWEAASKAGIQYTAGPAFFINGGSEEFIRLAYSWEAPERNYEGAKLIAQAIMNAR